MWEKQLSELEEVGWLENTETENTETPGTKSTEVSAGLKSSNKG